MIFSHRITPTDVRGIPLRNTPQFGGECHYDQPFIPPAEVRVALAATAQGRVLKLAGTDIYFSRTPLGNLHIRAGEEYAICVNSSTGKADPYSIKAFTRKRDIPPGIKEAVIRFVQLLREGQQAFGQPNVNIGANKPIQQCQ